MQLVLVRHGQSSNNAHFLAELAAHRARVAEDPGGARIGEELVGYQNRVPEPELTDLGVRQAQALGSALAEGRLPFAPTYLYASPMIRAVSTARALSEASGLPILLQPDAYEVGGVQEVDPRTGVRSRCDGAALPALQGYGGNVLAPPGLFPADGGPWSGGFETDLEDALPRAQRLLSDLLITHRVDDVVVLVCHQFFAQFVMAAALKWERPPWRRFRLDNTAHASLRLEHGEVLTEWVNRVEHLDPADVTN
ncbi:histidine phosphatase family protein [Kineosporia babensis]|uniref:Histidine phosphatase family protein n=1 Tax=Kineosporia babensis TaxID=499548 RepID=A0A9X1SRE2_9ACTN|nr:histidine phosphatase family protein [Kineosporia babensis]MCD5309552.1 histidine phosphatase family protein [Kineosporia babensis]